ncbi:MAG: PAS domain-containing protein [Deltaproteobacteria bacterium]|nr:PAS domain-containing protein [Deltaproteobacteria bacterium]
MLFQIQTVALAYTGIGIGFATAALLTNGPVQNTIIFAAMFAFTSIMLGALFTGHFTIVQRISISGYWLGFTFLVYNCRQFHLMEIHYVAVYYMAMIFVSGLLFHSTTESWAITLLSIGYVWCDFGFSQKASSIVDTNNIDDYIGTSIILFITILVSQYLHLLHSRQVNAAKKEVDTINEQAADLIGLNVKLKTSEREIRALRDYLAAMIDSMPSILISVDASGTIVQWNREAERALSIQTRNAVGQPLSQILPEFSRQAEMAARAIREGIVTTSPPLLVEGPKGANVAQPCYQVTTVYPIKTVDLVSAVIRIDEVTEQVRMQEMIVHTEKMISVGGLAAGMAHEINNPLAGILQNIAVIRNRLLEDLPANRKVADELRLNIHTMNTYLENRQIFKMLNLVTESGKRASEIVHNMLSFSRKGTGQMVSVELCDLVRHTIEIAKTEYDLKNHFDFKKVQINLDCHSCPPIWCETSKIQQVLLNILRNGAEAMQEANALGIISRPPRFDLRIAADETKEWAVMEIEDNGPGMNEAVRKRIFEPFFTTKEIGRGTGLGLSVSYFIITENHRGQIMVESEMGKGTTFIIRLPIASGPGYQ